MDTLGHHALSCINGGWVHLRHDRLVNMWTDILHLAGLGAHPEVSGLFEPAPGAEPDGRRADIVASGFTDGKTRLLDVTVTSANLQETGSVPTKDHPQGHSSLMSEQSKNKKYGVLPDALQKTENGYTFEPLAFECFGLMAWVHGTCLSYGLPPIVLRCTRPIVTHARLLPTLSHLNIQLFKN